MLPHLYDRNAFSFYEASTCLFPSAPRSLWQIARHSLKKKRYGYLTRRTFAAALWLTKTSLKNELLAEIIKQHRPNTNILLNVITNLGIQQPDWNELPLPRGQYRIY